jgi:phosphoheptose isomerase
MAHDSVLNLLCTRYPSLEQLTNTISEAADLLINCFAAGGKLLVCGNGGSCSDSEHLVGELMKSFELKRPVGKYIADKLRETDKERGLYLAGKLEGGLPAISLTSQTSLTTAISNDIDASLVFAQQVIAYGKKNDVLIAISTSGNAQNVVDACITARAMNLKVIGLTGVTGGKIKPYCDILVNVPEKRTVFIQELHLPVLHTIAMIIENYFFGNQK